MVVDIGLRGRKIILIRVRGKEALSVEKSGDVWRVEMAQEIRAGIKALS